MNWIWAIGGLLLFGVAAYSVYRAFRSPKFIAKLTKFASQQAWKAIKPVVTTPEDPDDRVKRIDEYRRGQGDGYFRRKSGAPPKG